MHITPCLMCLVEWGEEVFTDKFGTSSCKDPMFKLFLSAGLQAARDSTHRRRVMECVRVEEVEVNERDIPGAVLSEPVPVLRWWLLCCSIPPGRSPN